MRKNIWILDLKFLANKFYAYHTGLLNTGFKHAVKKSPETDIKHYRDDYRVSF